MGLVVNASQNPIKLSNNLSRIDGLLSFAVSSLSAGARPKDVKDGTADFGVKKIKIPPAPKDTNLKTSPDTDKILVSPSGWARMGALASVLSGQAMETQSATHIAKQVQQDLRKVPDGALNAQGYHSPGSVMKLLE